MLVSIDKSLLSPNNPWDRARIDNECIPKVFGAGFCAPYSETEIGYSLKCMRDEAAPGNSEVLKMLWMNV